MGLQSKSSRLLRRPAPEGIPGNEGLLLGLSVRVSASGDEEQGSQEGGTKSSNAAAERETILQVSVGSSRDGFAAKFVSIQCRGGDAGSGCTSARAQIERRSELRSRCHEVTRDAAGDNTVIDCSEKVVWRVCVCVCVSECVSQGLN